MTSENIPKAYDSRDDEFYRQIGDVNIRISGLNEEEKDVRDGVYAEIVKSLVKTKKMVHVIDFTLNIKKYHEAGSRKKYAINIRIICDSGDFQADASEWDIFKVVRIALDKLEKEIFRHMEKEKMQPKSR
ncbi:MAG: hypothetical protein JW789_01155 [Candidatus Aenigmarchaeota archaeon]|nr:hypothetical protein [Candidatus Aenigmarchaeota archaeon]